MNAKNLNIYERSENDVRKGIEGKEPNENNRLEKEDIMKMNLNEAVCDTSEDEESDNDNYEKV